MRAFTKATDSRICKIDESLGIVLGFAIICEENGRPYVDSQNHHIGESAMLKASASYMQGERPALQMHGAESAGQVIFAWPLTRDIASAFGIATKKTGLLIGMRCTDAVLAKYRDGTYTGFSIGGKGTIVGSA